MKNKHILFPFDASDLKASQIRQIERLFKRGGADVLSVEPADKTARTAGIEHRKIHVSFTDSQNVVLSVKESGDVYQVTINGRRVPMREQDDHEKSISEIAERLASGRTAFQKRLAKIKAPKPRGIKATPRRGVRAVLERTKALKEELSQVRAEIDAIKSQLPDGESPA